MATCICIHQIETSEESHGPGEIGVKTRPAPVECPADGPAAVSEPELGFLVVASNWGLLGIPHVPE